MLVDSEECATDDELDYPRVREQELKYQMRWEQVQRRRERKVREGFKVSIYFFSSHLFITCICTQELVDFGTIKERCKWKDGFPLFQDDESYLSLLVNRARTLSGSSATWSPLWSRRSTRKSTLSKMRSSGTRTYTLPLFKMI